jgi:hypothetical protein
VNKIGFEACCDNDWCPVCAVIEDFVEAMPFVRCVRAEVPHVLLVDPRSLDLELVVTMFDERRRGEGSEGAGTVDVIAGISWIAFRMDGENE